jgi:hypothetical protein
MNREQKLKAQWVLIRDGTVTNVFNNRREAVKYLKRMLRQTSIDFEKQDKNDEYDYEILIPRIEIIPILERDAGMSLL